MVSECSTSRSIWANSGARLWGILWKGLHTEWHVPGTSKCFLSSKIPWCPVPRDCSWMWNYQAGTSVNHWDGTLPPSDWPGLLAPPPIPGGENLICVRLWLWEQVDPCTCSWDPGPLCEGAFKWIKPFTCWRLNTLWDLWLDNPTLRRGKIYK